MTRLLEIANELKPLYSQRNGARLTKTRLEEDTERLKTFLTPAEGWQGKNAEERKTAAEKTFADHENLDAMSYELDDCLDEIAVTEAQIEGLEAERRALEWEVRIVLASALDANRIQANHRGDQIQHAFDDAADHAVVAEFDDVPF